MESRRLVPLPELGGGAPAECRRMVFFRAGRGRPGRVRSEAYSSVRLRIFSVNSSQIFLPDPYADASPRGNRTSPYGISWDARLPWPTGGDDGYRGPRLMVTVAHGG